MDFTLKDSFSLSHFDVARDATPMRLSYQPSPRTLAPCFIFGVNTHVLSFKTCELSQSQDVSSKAFTVRFCSSLIIGWLLLGQPPNEDDCLTLTWAMRPPKLSKMNDTSLDYRYCLVTLSMLLLCADILKILNLCRFVKSFVFIFFCFKNAQKQKGPLPEKWAKVS